MMYILLSFSGVVFCKVSIRYLYILSNLDQIRSFLAEQENVSHVKPRQQFRPSEKQAVMVQYSKYSLHTLGCSDHL